LHYNVGEDNSAWRGDEATYRSRHGRVYAKHGKASDYQCVDCTKSAQHWSQVHGTTGLNPDEYEPRCVSCHSNYDGNNVGQNHPRAKLDEEDVLEIRQLIVDGRKLVDIAFIYDIDEATVSNIKHRRIWKHI
jgi:hypothetical protein